MFVLIRKQDDYATLARLRRREDEKRWKNFSDRAGRHVDVFRYPGGACGDRLGNRIRKGRCDAK